MTSECVIDSGVKQDKYALFPDGMRICYRTYGSPSDEALLLIAGLGLQLDSWPEAMIDGFTRRGYYVIAFDNRDVGKSSRVETNGPGKLSQLFGHAPADNYDIGDMADDTARLIRHVKKDAVHVVGMSLGGMIGQTLASRYPELVRTLTSIFSTTGDSAVGQPAKSTLKLMATARVPKTKQEGIESSIRLLKHIGAPWSAEQEAMHRLYVEAAWDRSDGESMHLSVRRQIGAIFKSGNRTAQLRRIVAPTLVIHGDVDKMVHTSGGRATAEAIRGASLTIIKGMRHELTSFLSPELVAYIDGHARAARSSQ